MCRIFLPDKWDLKVAILKAERSLKRASATNPTRKKIKIKSETLLILIEFAKKSIEYDDRLKAEEPKSPPW